MFEFTLKIDPAVAELLGMGTRSLKPFTTPTRMKS